jgi:hypothetical protein
VDLEPSLASPRAEYQRRLEERRRQTVAQARNERLVGNARLAVFLAGVALACLVFGTRSLSAWWLLVPAVAFVALLFLYERVTRAWYRAGRAMAFWSAGLARLDHDWMGKGQQGERFLDEHHPYAADLDLFGKGSLFELLCTARTRSGEDTLAGWLKAPAPPDVVRARQAAVAELRPRLDLREDLALLGGDVPAGVDFDAVAAWGAAPPRLRHLWLRWVILALGVCTLVSLIGWLMVFFGYQSPDTPLGAFFERWGSTPFVGLAICELLVAAWLWRPVSEVLRVVEQRSRDLALLAHVLERLEDAEFTTPRLRELRDALYVAHERPSQSVARLGNLLDLLHSRRNQLFAPFAVVLMWGTQMAFALEAWRQRHGLGIAGWLRAVGEFEALCSLAAYAYENPSDPFPELLDAGRCYDAEGLAHPLLATGKCVPNDLHLADDRRVLVVSGSNMSGKSTFLRTVGVNAVLAQAGAPVRARRMRLSPLAVGATLRIQDSLQAGHSRFYAEILRVRQVVDLSRGPLPLLFLLDEIFAGTNSHDRRQGAEAVVQGLVRAGAIGLVTTHDLALTQFVERLGAPADNVHFEDHFEDGVMKFDYRLRPGVVQNSNALALMRAVGLEV